MSTRELVVLGCGSQAPSRERNHNGYLLRWDGEGLLFDPGEGTQRQLIYAGISASSITRILVTHFHGDHCLGLAGIFQRLSLDQVGHPIHVYFPASGRVYLDRLRGASVYHDRLETVYHPIDTDGVAFDEGPFRIEARALVHPVEAFGYRLEEPEGRSFVPEALARAGVAGPLVGALERDGRVEVGGREVRLEDVTAPRPGSVFAFVMDTRPCPGAIELARDADLLTIEATFLDEQAEQAVAYGHLTIGEATAIAREAGAKKVLLAHLSQRYPDPAPLRAAAERALPGTLVAEDLLRVPVPRPGRPGGPP